MKKFNTLLLFLVLVGFVFNTCIAQKPSKQKIKIGTVERDYLVVVPKSAPAKNRSLIIGLHGGGGNAAGVQLPMSLQSEKFGFVQFYPEAIEKTWNVGGLPTAGTYKPTADDIGFLRTLIDEAIKNYQVDPERVFLVGSSRGAMMALYAMTKMPEKITAVTSIIGSMPTMHQNFDLKEKVGLLVMNGTEDPFIPYNGGAAKDAKHSNGEVMATEEFVKKIATYNGAEDSPTKTEMPDKKTNDGCKAEVYTYNNQDKKGLVKLIKIVGGGHTIPGGGQYLPASIIGKVCKDFFAYEETYKFFVSFHK